MTKSTEQKAREILFEIGVDNPNQFSAGDLYPLTDLLEERETGMTKDAMRDAVKGMAQLTHIVSNYFLELKASGFSEEQALVLTKEYQTTILTMNTGGK